MNSQNAMFKLDREDIAYLLHISKTTYPGSLSEIYLDLTERQLTFLLYLSKNYILAKKYCKYYYHKTKMKQIHTQTAIDRLLRPIIECLPQ